MDDRDRCLMCEKNEAGVTGICDECWIKMQLEKFRTMEGGDVR